MGSPLPSVTGSPLIAHSSWAGNPVGMSTPGNRPTKTPAERESAAFQLVSAPTESAG